MAPVVYIIEGCIAAGKSVLLAALADELRERGLRVTAVPEPVHLWSDILPKFYQDPSRYAYVFQTLAFATRVQSIVQADWDCDVMLLERSPATDRVFMELQRGVMEPVEMRCYETWCDTYEKLLPFKMRDARVLFLRPTLDTCMTRLCNRKREGEVGEKGGGGVTREYQERLLMAHDAFLLGTCADLFPALRTPFDRSLVTVVPATMADANFRDHGEERTRVVHALASDIEKDVRRP